MFATAPALASAPTWLRCKHHHAHTRTLISGAAGKEVFHFAAHLFGNMKHATADFLAWSCVFGIVFIVLLPLTIIDHEKKDDYVETKCLVVSKDDNKHRCCEEECFECNSCDSSLPFCDALVKDKQEGKCCGESSCCRSYDYQNNRCRDEIYDSECEIVCGNCYTPTIVLEHVVLEPTERMYRTSFKEDCHWRQQPKCTREFYAKYAKLNETMTCYYHPEDPAKLHFDDGANIGLLVSCILFGVLTAALCAAAWYSR